jgi:peptidyl-prolyl cis-trans isomerase A (cyclophilin A)
MRILIITLLAILTLAGCNSNTAGNSSEGGKSAAKALASTSSVNVILETDLGSIVLRVDTDKAPLTSAYFLRIIDKGLYNGATFYRSASLDGQAGPQIIQGGILQNALTQTGPISATDFTMPTLPSVERTSRTGLTHQAGTVSFARDLLDTGVVIPEIFICLRACAWADEGARSVPDTHGFPAFGTVLEGMETVQAIANQETNGETSIKFLQGQIHSTPIVIRKAYRAPN